MNLWDDRHYPNPDPNPDPATGTNTGYESERLGWGWSLALVLTGIGAANLIDLALVRSEGVAEFLVSLIILGLILCTAALFPLWAVVRFSRVWGPGDRRREESRRKWLAMVILGLVLVLAPFVIRFVVLLVQGYLIWGGGGQ